jgi:hypothetical protein
MLHTNPAQAIRDWTTWAALTIASGIGGVSALLDDPWSRRLQITAAILGLIGTLIRGPQPKESDNADPA